MLILIIGIGFFLKYAFDQQWIGPAVRISIGFICGVVLLLSWKRLSSAKSPRLGHWDWGGWSWDALSYKLCGFPG